MPDTNQGIIMTKKFFLFLTAAALCCVLNTFAETYTPVTESDITWEQYLTDIRISHDYRITFYDNYKLGTSFTREYTVYIYEYKEDYGLFEHCYPPLCQYIYGNSSVGLVSNLTFDGLNLNSSGGYTMLNMGEHSVFRDLTKGKKYHMVIHPFSVIQGVSKTSYYDLDGTQNGFGKHYVNCVDFVYQTDTPDFLLGGKAIYGDDSATKLFKEDFSYTYNKANHTLIVSGESNQESAISMELYTPDLKISVNGEVCMAGITTSTNAPATKLTISGADTKSKLHLPILNCEKVDINLVALNAELGDDEILMSCRGKSINLHHCCVISEGRIIENGRVKDTNGNLLNGQINIAATGTDRCTVNFYSSTKLFDASTLLGEYKVEFGGSLSTVPAAPSTDKPFLGWAIQGAPNSYYSETALKALSIEKDINLMAVYGEANNAFSIGASKTVEFAPGNLQYTASSNTWSFASSQLEFLGENNINGSALADKIDLFGWGTGNTPTNTSTNASDYSSFKDWGANSISNGGTDKWFSLSSAEWDYLLNKRANAANLKSTVKVNGKYGLLLLPDNWTDVEGITITPGIVVNYTNGNYTLAQWQKLEQNGAVFLPICGEREGLDMYFISEGNIAIGGGYWTSTSVDDTKAYMLQLYIQPKADVYGYSKYDGGAVRLAKNATASASATLYSVELLAQNGGYISGAVSGAYEEGAVLNITAAAFTEYGFQFVEWSDGEKQASRTITVNGDITLEARFTNNAEGIEDVRRNDVQCTKELRNGQLFIKKNGQVYNILGARVK